MLFKPGDLVVVRRLTGFCSGPYGRRTEQLADPSNDVNVGTRCFVFATIFDSHTEDFRVGFCYNNTVGWAWASNIIRDIDYVVRQPREHA